MFLLADADPVDMVRKLINKMSMKCKRLVNDVIIVAEPQDLIVIHQPAVGVYHKHNFYIAINGGRFFAVPSLADMLLKLCEVFRCFNCKCPREASSFFNFLAAVRGVSSDKPLSRTQKILLS